MGMSEAKVQKAEVVKLLDLIAYQAGSVVSREIVSRPTGTATLFAFDADQGLSEHTAPFDAVVQILDGEACLVIGGQEISAAAGQLVVMPAHVPHSLRAERRFKMLLTMIRS